MIYRLIALALTFCLLAAQPADAAPVAGLIAGLGAAFKAAVTVKAIALAALRLVITVGASRLLQKRQQRKQKRAGLQTTHTTSGGTDPQGTVLGFFATGGHLTYTNSRGPNHSTLTYVIEVSDIPGVALKRLIVDGELSKLEAIENSEWLAVVAKRQGRVDRARVKFLDGNQTEADADLVEWYGNAPERPWTAMHKLSGIAYAIIECDRDDKAFPGGRPEFRFELEGIPLYDPRQDDSVGGTGPMRWTDRSTWKSTRNPVVIAYNIKRGLTLPCGSVWGGDFGAGALPLTSWVPAMNVCDVKVGEANRPQFEIGYEVRFEEQPADVLEEIYSSINAQVVELAGTWHIQVGVPSAPKVHITDGTPLISSGQNHDPFPGLEKTHNAVAVNHTSPAALWNGAALNTLLFPEFEAQDGTQRLFELQLPMVFSAEQGRQVGDALIRDNRRFNNHKHTLPPEHFGLNVLETLSWTSEWNSYTDKDFEITQIAYDLRTFRTTVSLKEVDPADFDPILDLEIPDAPRALFPPNRTDAGVLGFDVRPFIQKDAQGKDRRAEILATWDRSLATTVNGIAFEIRVQAQPDVVWTATTTDVARGSFVISGVLPDTTYEVRPLAITSRRAAEWGPWKPVTTDDLRLTEADLSDAVWNRVQGDATARAQTVLDQFRQDTFEPQMTGQRDDINAILARNEDADLQLGETANMQSRLEAALDQVTETATEAILLTSRTTTQLYDAGVRVDPETGQVYIQALRQQSDEIVKVSQRMDAQDGRIEQSVTRTEVNQAIAAAQLDPADLGALTDLQLRVIEVRQELDASKATINTKASATFVEGLNIRLNTAETSIDALENEISTKVEAATFNSAFQRLQAAEQALSLVDGPTLTQSVADVRRTRNEFDTLADADLDAILQSELDRQLVMDDLAIARQQLKASIEDAKSALASLITGLKTRIVNAESTQTAETRARSELAGQVEQLEDGQSAQGSALTALGARLSSAEANRNTDAQAINQLQVKATQTDNAIASQAQAQTGLAVQVATQAAELTQERTTRASENAARVQEITQTVARVQGAENTLGAQAGRLSSVESSVNSIGGQLSAEVTRTDSIAATVGQHSVAIQAQQQVSAGMGAAIRYNINVNGHIAGWALNSAVQQGGAPWAAFTFVADAFQISSINGAKTPFVVYTSPRVIDGITVPAGVYLDSLFVRQGSIKSAHIGLLEVDEINIKNGAISDYDVAQTSTLLETTSRAFTTLMSVSTVSHGGPHLIFIALDDMASNLAFTYQPLDDPGSPRLVGKATVRYRLMRGSTQIGGDFSTNTTLFDSPPKGSHQYRLEAMIEVPSAAPFYNVSGQPKLRLKSRSIVVQEIKK